MPSLRQNDSIRPCIEGLRLTNIESQNGPLESVPSDRLWLRSELMGTQVITRDTGRRLGVVGEVVVDIDRREVVALGLRDNPLTRFLPGLPRWMQIGRAHGREGVSSAVVAAAFNKAALAEL